MKTEEDHRRELISMPDQTLETLIDLRFVWLDSVTREERDEFYMRQEVAQVILAERRGIPLPPRRDTTGSIWTRSKPTF